MTKQLGRIPRINHTDHANLARLDTLELSRIEPKHFRWFVEITAGGSLLIHRPGTSSAHKGPDGLSRNCEGRDKLILAKSADWKHYRERIKGMQEAIASGEADDDEPQVLDIEVIGKERPEDLEPLPTAEGLAVSLKYEQGAQDHKFKHSSGGKAKAQAEAEQKTSGEPDSVKITYFKDPINRDAEQRFCDVCLAINAQPPARGLRKVSSSGENCL